MRWLRPGGHQCKPVNRHPGENAGLIDCAAEAGDDGNLAPEIGENPKHFDTKLFGWAPANTVR